MIPQLLSECGHLQDPHSGQPLRASEIDLMTVWPPYVSVTGFPLFVNEQMIKEHFETLAGGQQVKAVLISEDKQKAMVMYEYPSGKITVLDSVSLLISVCVVLCSCIWCDLNTNSIVWL